jgi:ribA/ribD-fused uncharacterized protein
MTKPKVITQFRGEYYYLSNFEIEPDGSHVEAEFQAQKTLIPSQRARIITAGSPAAARRVGKDKTLTTLRPDWEEIKIDRMHMLVEQKFCTWKDLAAKLLTTGGAVLQEGNFHGDDYWGLVWENGEWRGENMLGYILMSVRTDLEKARRSVRRKRGK